MNDDFYDKTTVRQKISFLKDLTKEEFVLQLIPLIKTDKHIHSAYIFGSFFTEHFHVDSDLDLIVVWETSINFIERPLAFPELQNLPFVIDLLVYTPAEFEKIKNNPSPGFWRTAFSQMKVIISG
jgi:predicted nucleotidyltransferase